MGRRAPLAGPHLLRPAQRRGRLSLEPCGHGPVLVRPGLDAGRRGLLLRAGQRGRLRHGAGLRALAGHRALCGALLQRAERDAAHRAGAAVHPVVRAGAGQQDRRGLLADLLHRAVGHGGRHAGRQPGPCDAVPHPGRQRRHHLLRGHAARRRPGDLLGPAPGIDLCPAGRGGHRDHRQRKGLGQTLAYLGSTFDINGVMALLLVLALLGVGMVRFMSWAERRLLHWQ